MRKLLLGSSGIGGLRELLPDIDNAHLGYVPTAAGRRAEEMFWVQEDRRQLEALGCGVTTLDLAGASERAVKKVLAAADVVFATGGNAYVLLWHARRSGFARLVSQVVADGNLVYVGTSAGAILAGPDLEPAASAEGREEMPDLDDTTGLRLVDFSVLPHDNDPERNAYNAVVAGDARPGRFYRLRDDQAVLVRGEHIAVIQSAVLG
jgi:dipeptidase E